MPATETTPQSTPGLFTRTVRRLALMLAWRRLRFALGTAALFGLIISPAFETTPALAVMFRLMLVGLMALLAFGLFEFWPARLPRWLARWALQVLGVAWSIPLTTLAIYLFLTRNEALPFWQNELRLSGFFMITVLGLLFAPWLTVSALFRQRDFAAHSQALAFELERSEMERQASELERQATDARLRLLQRQVEPHFLFNTLANVRELVDAGSPQASQVLASLIAYLRAAVPRLHEPATTLAQELELVRAYLELMHMRMPDRLQFSIDAEPAAQPLACPSMTVLTLVENAVRHGIDPGEDGGRIDVRVRVQDGRCRISVIDTGVGLKPTGTADSLGTGLANLRERLQLVFAGDARLSLIEQVPRGVCAELDFPAEKVPAQQVATGAVSP